MDIQKGRKHLSENNLRQLRELEIKLQRSKNKESKIKFTASDKAKLDAFYRMVDYLGAANG